jgi:hypothetical protein
MVAVCLDLQIGVNKMIRVQKFFLLPLIWILTACASAPATPQPAPTLKPTSSPVPTVRPTKTSIPTVTAIPGFEAWLVLNPQAVEIKSDHGTLTMTLLHRALWFMEQRGVLLYQSVDGNFKITAYVHTAKSSDPTQPPGGNGSVQLGGLMVRNGQGGRENYVFIVVGDDGDGLSIETKNTVDSFSKYTGPAWDAAEAELRLCRVDQQIKLYKRHVGSSENWISAAYFDRPDLPQTLQVGLNIYSDSTPDLQIRFDHIKIDLISSLSDCEKP